MNLPDAAQLIGLGVVLFGAGFVLYVGLDFWLKAKREERAESALSGSRQVTPDGLSAIEARLRRIEQMVETSAIEIERIAEAQRFSARLLADQTRDKNQAPTVR